MKIRYSITNLLVILFLFPLIIFSQDDTEIDPSKPTNLYTQVNANLEYTTTHKYDLYGIRANIQYALNPDNLFLFEIPFLYNDSTKKFGMFDIRLRYFAVIKRNITKSFIALAPFIDITAPTGSFEPGLGQSVWSLAAGLVFGFAATKDMALFPGVSVIHITKPITDLIPEELKTTSTGIGFQFNLSYKFTKSIYVFINPTPLLLNTEGDWKVNWLGEFSLNNIFIPNKFKMNIFWLPNFTTDSHSLRLGGTLYL